MKTMAVMELKGFTQIADSLALKMDHIGLTPERVRASIVEILSTSIKRTNALQHCTQWFYVGGDTWFFIFDDLADGIRFSSMLLGVLFNAISSKGLFYIKPSIAINVGEPKIQNERFLDGDSILAYRIADKGTPYKLRLVNNAVMQSERYDWVIFSGAQEQIDDTNEKYVIRDIDWQNIVMNLKLDVTMPDFDLPSLLLDGEVLFSENVHDAMYNLVKQQKNSSSVFSFGGPVDIRQPIYMDYVKGLITQAKKQSDFHVSIINYLPIEKPELCHIWLEVCMTLSELLKEKSICKLFVLQKESIRPISYHVFNDEVIFLGLRAYSVQRGISTMSSSIMFRNKKIASKFKDEFMESWRLIDNLDSKYYQKLLSTLSEITVESRNISRSLVGEIIQHAESL